MHWYHDHRLDDTGPQLWHGLTGMWISDDDARRLRSPCRSGDRDIPLMISDRSFDKHNQLTDPFGGSAPRAGRRRDGHDILVNGAVLPHHAGQRPPLPAAGPQRVQLPLLQPEARAAARR